MNVEAEVNKYKTCRDRDELGRMIREYKSLAMQHATNMVMAGQYNMVARKLEEIFDKLPAPHLKNIPGSHMSDAMVKTASITDAENARINADWRKKTGKK
jgi:hypothetical protein